MIQCTTSSGQEPGWARAQGVDRLLDRVGGEASDAGQEVLDVVFAAYDPRGGFNVEHVNGCSVVLRLASEELGEGWVSAHLTDAEARASAFSEDVHHFTRWLPRKFANLPSIQREEMAGIAGHKMAQLIGADRNRGAAGLPRWTHEPNRRAYLTTAVLNAGLNELRRLRRAVGTRPFSEPTDGADDTASGEDSRSIVGTTHRLNETDETSVWESAAAAAHEDLTCEEARSRRGSALQVLQAATALLDAGLGSLYVRQSYAEDRRLLIYMVLRTTRSGWNHLPADHLPSRAEITQIAGQAGLAIEGTYKDIHSNNRLLNRTLHCITQYLTQANE